MLFTIDIFTDYVYHISKAAMFVIDLSLTSKQKLGSFNRVRNVMPPMSGRQDVLCEHPLAEKWWLKLTNFNYGIVACRFVFNEIERSSALFEGGIFYM